MKDLTIAVLSVLGFVLLAGGNDLGLILMVPAIIGTVLNLADPELD